MLSTVKSRRSLFKISSKCSFYFITVELVRHSVMLYWNYSTECIESPTEHSSQNKTKLKEKIKQQEDEYQVPVIRQKAQIEASGNGKRP